MFNQQNDCHSHIYFHPWPQYHWKMPLNEIYNPFIESNQKSNIFIWNRFQFQQNQNKQIHQKILQNNQYLQNKNFVQRREKQEQIKEKIILSQEELLAQSYQKKKSTWTEEEDIQLCRLVQQEKLSWKQISDQMPKRTYKMCYSRYKRINLEGKNIWTRDQEETIKKLISKYGPKWKILSAFLPKRNPKQIRQRYINFIRPNIKNNNWTIEEDMRLIELINQHGNKWRKIQQFLGNRSQNQIKNRYFSRILKIWNEKKKQNTKILSQEI